MDDNSSKTTSLLDNAAVALSGLCLLHCLALPMLIAVLPFLGQFGAGHFHIQMLIAVVPVSIIAFALGFRRHHSRSVVAWGGVGVLLLMVGGTIAHGSYGIVADRLLTICGALILAAAHYFNNRFSRHRKYDDEAVLINI
ncbi:MAG: MerC domain-containing protein [Proteobacteria bacterium]|nr:MerC domain-containing protein [Pseudomonadota bacterium]